MDTDVDGLLDTLASGVFVSGDSFSSNAAAGHPHFSNFKNRGMAAERQARRRQEFLGQQKTKRQAALALVRHLGAVETDEDVTEMECESQEGASAKPKSDKSSYRRKQRQDNPFQNQLMCSEWFIHVPENVSEQWIMVPCPEGKRVLVIANQGSTKAYAKNGYLLKQFSSAIPGDFKNNSSRTTVLDCVFCEDQSVFYCLDVLCWNGCPVFDSDTRFRFFWLKSKLDELPELQECSSSNRYAFRFITRCACERDEMESIMKEKFPFKVDGLLFYHNEVHYTAGQTPLVGWLKPFMLPEILNVEVPPEYTEGYEKTESSKFIADFDSEYENRHGGRQYGGKKREGKAPAAEGESAETMDA